MSEIDSSEGSTAPVRRRRGKKSLWIILGSLVLIIALILGIGAVYWGNLKNSFESKSQVLDDAFPDGSRPGSGANGSMNILLLGSDKRPQPVKKGIPGGGGDERTDSIMLVNVSGDRQKITVMSIMRDLWVDIPGKGAAKINAGYAFGGRKLEVQTIENLLKTKIDHVAIIDMESFQGLGDAVGGLEVNVEKPTTLRTLKERNLAPGKQHLNGEEALAYSRERYSYSNGDYQRVRNQQAVLRALLDKLVSRQTLTDPSKIKDIVDKTSPYLSVDSGFTFEEMTKLGISLRSVNNDDITFATFPTAGTGWSSDGQSIVKVDEAALPSLQKALAEDRFREWTASANNHEQN